WPKPVDGRQKVYFLGAKNYVRYDVVDEKSDDGFPQEIAGKWPALLSPGGVQLASVSDASALPWPKPIDGHLKIYFFAGSSYGRYDVDDDRIDPDYPQPIDGKWFPEKLTGRTFTNEGFLPVLWPNGKAYFLSHGLYLSYDIAAEAVDGPPKAIRNDWDLP